MHIYTHDTLFDQNVSIRILPFSREHQRRDADGAAGTQFTCFTSTKVQILTSEEHQRSAAPPPSPASGASVYRAAPPSPAEAATQFELFDELLPICIPSFPGSAKEEEETISELISELVQLCEEEMWEHAGAMHGRMVGLAATLADYDVPRAVMIYSNLALALSNLADLSTEPVRSMSLWNEAIDMQDRVRNIAIRFGLSFSIALSRARARALPLSVYRKTLLSPMLPCPWYLRCRDGR
jgi:hypothetical protein